MTTQTLTLTDFLLARIAEDEDAIKCIESVTYHDRWFTYPNGETKHVSPHGLVLHGPRRLLAECEAKRRIVARSRRASAATGGALNVYAPILQDLALPYADHPDYREEWKP